MNNIRPEEIDSVEEIGMLDGEAVKMITTKGGLKIAVKTGAKGACLGSASHPAILKYNIEKSHKGYSPMLAKSDLTDEVVTGLSDYLPQGLHKAGCDLYSLSKSDSNVKTYVFTKSGIDLTTYHAEIVGDSMVVSNINAKSKEALALAANSVAEAIARDAANSGCSFLEYSGQKFKVEDVI